MVSDKETKERMTLCLRLLSTAESEVTAGYTEKALDTLHVLWTALYKIKEAAG